MRSGEPTGGDAGDVRGLSRNIAALYSASRELAESDRYIRSIHPETMTGQDWHAMRKDFLTLLQAWSQLAHNTALLLEQIEAADERSHSGRRY